MKKFFLSILTFLFLLFSSFAQIPTGYYDSAAGKTGEALRAVLHNIIKGQNVITYTPGVWIAFHTTDVKPNGTVWDMYSDIPNGTPNGNPPYVYQIGTDQCGTATQEGDCYSREHSWPKSWFGGEVYPMYTDLFHIYPTDQYVNGMRNDNPYGEVGTATWTSENGSMLGPCVTSGYSGTVFEPIGDYKGDLARTYFYMSTRYYSEDAGWPGSDMTDGAQIKDWALNLLLHWSKIDPVSEKESNRNEAIYQIQNNRNPFIDHPEYVNLIWGNPIGINESNESVLSMFPNPAKENCCILFPAGTAIFKEISVFSVTGTKVKISVIASENKILLDLKDLSKGVYFIAITDKKDSSVRYAKLLKE